MDGIDHTTLYVILKNMQAPHLNGIPIYVITATNTYVGTPSHIYREVVNGTYRLDDISSPDPEFKDVKEFLTEERIKAIKLQHKLGIGV